MYSSFQQAQEIIRNKKNNSDASTGIRSQILHQVYQNTQLCLRIAKCNRFLNNECYEEETLYYISIYLNKYFRKM